jgi:hypothetical protein
VIGGLANFVEDKILLNQVVAAEAIVDVDL